MCIFCERAAYQLATGELPADVRRAAERCEVLRAGRILATILTGFLGSGKTTFLNYVMRAPHGKKIGVIQNEFGSVSIDDQLMPTIKADENSAVILMPNGCICCRVRGDLVEALKTLVELNLDSVIIECSGLSEVAPVAQTFFADALVQSKYTLDAVLCVCDAQVLQRASTGQLQDKEVETLLAEQMSLADVCLLNKCDKVNAAERDQLVKWLGNRNPSAKVLPCRQGKVNLAQVMNVNAFSLDQAISVDKHFLEDGDSLMVDGNGHGHGHGDGGHGHGHEHAHSHFSSVGLRSTEEMDGPALNEWLKAALLENSKEIIRIKGVINVKGEDRRKVIQGVHGTCETGPEAEDATITNPNESRLVMIGRINWDLRHSLERGFAACVASKISSAM
eukprot:gnl/MRDRNA2_/MRDRNA2_82263_c0_seq1.p1 gnl/MRDRNA2_/MRDRNA2_82263_c0~~gnl/MRDRNA2_/MRDRNA2_82263_c0_seq1.p1  ORF type:complete len:392 (+),score=90.93 gnl/MRDRNA2_/MRDRNA2_82263_c0_seq1:87-1262(+)